MYRMFGESEIKKSVILTPLLLKKDRMSFEMK
jgi:hypothetical protein